MLLKLAKYLKSYKKQCILGPLFKFFEAVLELLLPTIMALIINEGIGQRDTVYVLKMGGLMVLLASCGYVCSLICQYMASVASQGLGNVLRNEIFARISKMSYSQIDSFGAPTLTNRITNDVNQLQNFVNMMIRMFTRAFFLIIGAVLMSMLMDFRMSLILIAAAPVFALIIYFITAKASPLYRRYQIKLDHLGTVLRENLSGIRVIRAFARTRDEKRRFDSANADLTETGLNIGRVSALFNPLTSLAVNAVIIAILWVGSIHINSGNLSQGQIIAFINYANQILYALLAMSNLIILLTKAITSAARVNEILDTKPELTDAPYAPYAPDTENIVPAVSFKNVTLRYGKTGDAALEDINIEITRGETVGVIGGTGAGKSSFVNLIPRFYDAESGEVCVDGINVKDYPLEALREKVGLVPQKAVLFSGTVAWNICMGRRNASDAEVETAARIAQADEFIAKLPQGYNTPVSRGGMNFSGGQKQRLTIARAVIKEPEILILDDASSALDFATDARLRRAIKEECAGATVIIVSQRAGVVKNADRIIVFDDGKIAGLGSHSELMQKCEVYRQICLSQLSQEEV